MKAEKVNQIKARLKEPSTWAGIATVLGAAGVIAFPQVQAITQLCTVLAGVLAIVLPEQKA